MHRFMTALPSSLPSLRLPCRSLRKRATRPSSRPSARPSRSGERRHVDRPFLALGQGELGQRVERVRPVGAVDEIEVGVARVVGDRAPVLRILHAVDDRAVAARALAEAAAMLARGEGAELGVDQGNELLREVVGVAADRRRVDVLVAAERGEAVGKDEDRRRHLLLLDQPRGALGHVLGVAAPSGVAGPAAHEADQIEQHRVAAAGVPGVVVLRRQPDVQRPGDRVAEGIALEHLRGVAEYDETAGRAGKAFDRHDALR